MKESNLSLGDTIKKFITAFTNVVSYRLQKQILQFLYQHIVVMIGGGTFYSFVEHDFLWKSLSAMKVLHSESKHNLLYHLSRCFLLEEENGSTRMPLNRMPYGLIDYNIRFFSSTSSNKLGLEEHYAQWLETMVAHFGQKWLCLFRGPCWQYELNEESQQTGSSETPCVSSSSNEEVLDGLIDNTNTTPSNNEIPCSSNLGTDIQHSLLVQSLSGMNDKIPMTSMGQNPEHSDGEILIPCTNESLVVSSDVIQHTSSVNADTPLSSDRQQSTSTDDEMPCIANEKSASLIADALRDCSLNLDEFSNDDQGCLFDFEDISFQLEDASRCLVDNGDNGTCSSENVHAVENGNHLAGSFNSRTTKRSYLWTNITADEKDEIESGQISPECMEDHHNIVPTTKAMRSRNPYMYNTTKVSKNYVYSTVICYVF